MVAQGNQGTSRTPAIVLCAGVAGLIAFAATSLSGAVTPIGVSILSAIATTAGALLGSAATAHEHRAPLAGLALLVVLAGGAPTYMLNQRHAPVGVAELVGGCARFTVFAQNRWNPVGAAKRAKPLADSNKVGSFAPNELVAVDGWVRTQPAYPTNKNPWDSDVWFHVADGTGWVAFAAVRADPTPYDPTGFSDQGGRPVPLASGCSASVRWPSP